MKEGSPKSAGKPANIEPKRKNLSPATQRAVWARSGGICAFPGCGMVLYEDSLNFKSSYFGELAHNVAAKPNGPRGSQKRSHQLSDDAENLILFCPNHHSMVDKPGWEENYPEDLLSKWKRQHEACIRVAGQNSHGRSAMALSFLGVIGRQVLSASTDSMIGAAIQRGLVLTERPYELQIDASGYEPQSPEYWTHVITEIRKQIGRLQSQGQGHSAIALFGIADMPALMAVGFALGHSAEVHSFQWNRYANSWSFPKNDSPAVEFKVTWPETLQAPLALVLSLSGEIELDRVINAFPEPTPAIIHVTVEMPNLDLVDCAATIEAFRVELAHLFARLERHLPKTTMLNVFPAMPASLAVVFGMSIKPKVAFPIRVFDAEGPGGPFYPALTLPDKALC